VTNDDQTWLAPGCLPAGAARNGVSHRLGVRVALPLPGARLVRPDRVGNSAFVKLALALVATLASSCALNVGYLLEHGAVGKLPPLSIRSPLTSLRHLLGSRRWVLGFAIESCGWALFVLALALAPLSLVQATAAGGIGILALLVSRVTNVPLSRHERLGVLIAVAGLVLLGISLAGGHGEGGGAGHLTVGLWIGASAVAALASVQLLSGRIGAAPAYGIAAGLLFAAGDIATKGAVETEKGHLAFIAALIAAYAFGTLVLQAGFQRGSALTTAGIATLLTNALPIVAGMTIFGEPLPEGWLGAVRIAAFACVVVGAVFLGERRHPGTPGEAPEPSRRATAPEKPSPGAESRGSA
jgi:drug/metabolite transporter (DMT)-like permease